MNEPKHTPGPWRISGESDTIVQADDRAIGSESGLLIASAHGYANSGYFPSDDEAAANARLIAAAPDMLEALDCLTAVIGLTPIKGNLEALQEAYEQARAAIAKAKGEGQHHA